LLGSVTLWVAAAVGAAVAEPIHGQHPEMAREVRDLHLPVTRVDEGPGGHQEDRLLALAVDLVEEALPVPLGEALDVGVGGAALPAFASDRSLGGPRRSGGFHGRVHRPPRSSEVSQPSIAASSSACPRSKPSRRSFRNPFWNCITSAARASAEKFESSRAYSSIASASASLSRARQPRLTVFSRSRISGRFHASASSSAQTLG